MGRILCESGPVFVAQTRAREPTNDRRQSIANNTEAARLASESINTFGCQPNLPLPLKLELELELELDFE